MVNQRIGRALVALLTTALVALAPTMATAGAEPADPTPGGPPLVGLDVSFPQCGHPLPAPGPFTIVGVNGGLAYSANPCLAAQYDWALAGADPADADVALYANTGNPGPVASKRWPTGQSWPRVCDGSWDEACSYDYGWNAAGDAFGVAAESLPYGAAANATWWLDVEMANSWNHTDLDTNVAALRGFVDRLQILAPVHEVGIYSTRYQWGLITGATAPDSPRNEPFVDVPNWVAGATAQTAQAFCDDSFTGGPVRYVQYVDGIDHDLACRYPDQAAD